MSTDIKYSGESNKQIFNYLVRHFPIEFPSKEAEFSNWGKILIEDKTYLLHTNKKFLKDKIYFLIEEDRKEFVDTEEKQRDLRKTIKHYIDSARELKNEYDVICLSHYSNLQPLWVKENLKKSNKIIN